MRSAFVQNNNCNVISCGNNCDVMFNFEIIILRLYLNYSEY